MQIFEINAATGKQTAREMTAAEQAEYDARQAAGVGKATADAQAAADEATRRQLVVTNVQTAVGVNISALTVAQQKALIVALLYKCGALDKAGVVQPLASWL